MGLHAGVLTLADARRADALPSASSRPVLPGLEAEGGEPRQRVRRSTSVCLVRSGSCATAGRSTSAGFARRPSLPCSPCVRRRPSAPTRSSTSCGRVSHRTERRPPSGRMSRDSDRRWATRPSSGSAAAMRSRCRPRRSTSAASSLSPATDSSCNGADAIDAPRTICERRSSYGATSRSSASHRTESSEPRQPDSRSCT